MREFFRKFFPNPTAMRRVYPTEAGFTVRAFQGLGRWSETLIAWDDVVRIEVSRLPAMVERDFQWIFTLPSGAEVLVEESEPDFRDVSEAVLRRWPLTAQGYRAVHQGSPNVPERRTLWSRVSQT